MKILVTGAAGFIGSHTSASLIADAHDVIGMDNFDPFYDRQTKETNLQPLLQAGNFQFIEADIRDADRMTELLAEHHVPRYVTFSSQLSEAPSHRKLQLRQRVAAGPSCNVLYSKHLSLLQHSLIQHESDYRPQ